MNVLSKIGGDDMDKELIEMISNLLDKKLDPIKEDISGIKEDVKYIKVQQEEQGRILRILVDKAETNRADHDAMSNSIIQLSGKVENMRKDMAALEIVSARNMEYIAALKLLK